MKLNLRDLAEAAAYDPSKTLFEAAGDLRDYEVNTDLLLVATYIAPPHTVKGPDGKDIIIHRTDKGMMEDRFQGKVGLVLKTGGYGPAMQGFLKPEAGDWIVYLASNASEMFIRDRRKSNDGLSVRILDARFVYMIVSDPSLIY